MAQVVAEQLFLFEVGVDVARLRRESLSLIASGARSRNTELAYESNWRRFASWCKAAGRDSLPATEETVCFYLVDLSSRCKVATVVHHAWAVGWGHTRARLASPIGADVRALLAGLRRERGSERRPKSAITPDEIRRISEALDRRTFIGARDSALLLLGYSTGLRCSDLTALDLGDVSFVTEGAVVRVGSRKREKNDQAGQGRVLGVPLGVRPSTCPVLALQSWLRKRGREAGPLFVRVSGPGVAAGKLQRLGAAYVSAVVKGAVALIGLDESSYSAHSLRASMVTASAAAGASDSSIMLRSGHKSVQMIGVYRRHSEVFDCYPLGQAL